VEALAPYFAQAEQRLNITPWLVPPNENNDLLRRGAAKLGIPASAISRNVKGCWNLGSCGLGCPTNAKQSMLVTTIPAALDLGAHLLVETRAERFELANGKVTALSAAAGRQKAPRWCMDRYKNSSKTLCARRRRDQLAGRAVALAGARSPRRSGRRTFLHPWSCPPACSSRRSKPGTAHRRRFTAIIPGDAGDRRPHRLQAGGAAAASGDFRVHRAGLRPGQHDLLKSFPQPHLAGLLRDGFHDESPGGQVKLRGDGSAVLDYPLTPYVMEGGRGLAVDDGNPVRGRRAQVLPLHEMAQPYTSWAQARDAVNACP
jgi:hypothetical protein